MLNESYRNSLRLYAYGITSSANHADKLILKYQDYFNSLGKYEQLSHSLIIEHDGWEKEFDESFGEDKLRVTF